MKKETDLAGVKSVAKMLLMTDVHETEFSPVVVQHPFTSSGIVVLPEKGGGDFMPLARPRRFGLARLSHGKAIASLLRSE